MFDFSGVNEQQKIAITSVKGPVLITAGPGTGKTHTLVQRAIYLITECGVEPSEIMMATFTEKAAKEIITRISNELLDRGICINISEMYIGTFHSICLRILKDNQRFTRLKNNFRLFDDFDQKYIIYQNLRHFKNIKNFDIVIKEKSAWNQTLQIAFYVNNIAEELM